MRSRRSRKLCFIASAASCGPLIASTAAHWLICEAHDSVLVIQRVKTGASAGLEVKPMRQPVIAQVFEAPSEMMVRSYMPGTCAIEKNSPDVRQARVDLVGVHPDLRMLLQHRGDRLELLRVESSRRSGCAGS